MNRARPRLGQTPGKGPCPPNVRPPLRSSVRIYSECAGDGVPAPGSRTEALGGWEDLMLVQRFSTIRTFNRPTSQWHWRTTPKGRVEPLALGL